MQRLSVRAALDDAPNALDHAKEWAADGDESWEQWLVEYQRGDALILRLELRLELEDGLEVLTIARDGFFVENHRHTPRVEAQIAELATGDLAALAEELGRRGYELDLGELGSMYFHVELDAEVRRRLHGSAAPG